MSMYRGRGNRDRCDNRFDIDDVLIRADRVNVIEDDDRRGRHCCHDRRDKCDRCDNHHDRRDKCDNHHDRRNRCGHHHDRTLVMNVDDVTILADDVFVNENDNDRHRRRHHHNGCGCHHGRR